MIVFNAKTRRRHPNGRILPFVGNRVTDRELAEIPESVKSRQFYRMRSVFWILCLLILMMGSIARADVIENLEATLPENTIIQLDWDAIPYNLQIAVWRIDRRIKIKNDIGDVLWQSRYRKYEEIGAEGLLDPPGYTHFTWTDNIVPMPGYEYWYRIVPQNKLGGLLMSDSKEISIMPYPPFPSPTLDDITITSPTSGQSFTNPPPSGQILIRWDPLPTEVTWIWLGFTLGTSTIVDISSGPIANFPGNRFVWTPYPSIKGTGELKIIGRNSAGSAVAQGTVQNVAIGVSGGGGSTTDPCSKVSGLRVPGQGWFKDSKTINVDLTWMKNKRLKITLCPGNGFLEYRCTSGIIASITGLSALGHPTDAVSGVFDPVSGKTTIETSTFSQESGTAKLVVNASNVSGCPASCPCYHIITSRF